MIDFEWTIQQIFDGIPRGVLDIRCTRTFLRPHDAIWPEDACQFRSLADRIYNELPSPQMKRQFLVVCLASYFLNPPKAPATVPSWIQDKCPIADLLGCDISIETATGWYWGRAAIPVVDDLNKGHADRIVYALVAFSKGGSHPLHPGWVKNCLKSDSVDAVETAADLMVSRHSAIGFFFWPLIDPQKPVSGKSLGLPVYLSFLSLVKGGAIPPLLATGALDRQGTLIPVKGLPEKLDLAYKKQFKGFVYPKDGYLPLEAERCFDPQGVSTLEEAEQAWGIGPARDLTRLRKILKPVPFEGEIDRLTRDFAGRTKLCEQIDQWASAPDGEKVFWLTGEPGIGKSAIAAKICATRNYIAAYHFCDFNSEEKRDPAKLVRSLTYQLAVSIPEFGDRLNGEPIEQYLQEYSEAYTLFDKLITQPLSDNFAHPKGCMVILIDALDEATRGSRNEIASILSQVAERVPSWLRFIVTSRPEQEISTHFQAFSKHEIEPSNQDNQDDIAAYLNNRLPGITQDQIEMILERSDGNFLYVRHVTDEIRGNLISLDRIHDFPKGLNAVYHRFFDRQFSKDLAKFDAETHPLLCLVLAAFEPLSLSLLRQVLEIKDRKKFNDSIKQLGTLFPLKGKGDSSVILPWHRSIKDWLITQDRSGRYFVDIEYGHSLLAECGWKQYQEACDNIQPYFLVWLPSHLRECGRITDNDQFLQNFSLMMARAEAGLLERILADYQETRSDILRREKAFFRRNAHILRREDTDWPAHKILLQLAIEHADDSPLTEGAEFYLKEGKCKWPWLRRELRADRAENDNCLAVFEGHLPCVSVNDKCLTEFGGHGPFVSVRNVLIFPDGRILSWSYDATLRLWGEDGKPVAVFEGHSEEIMHALLLPDGRILSCSMDSTLRLWGQDGQPLEVMRGHTGLVQGALLFPDGRILSWSEDSTLRIWDQDGQPLSVMNGHTDYVIWAKLLPDNRILSWSFDSTLRIWDKDGKILKVMAEHSEFIRGALPLSDGRILSWSEDSTLRLWKKNGQPLFALSGHSGFVRGALAFPDGRLLSWSADGTLRIWAQDGTPRTEMNGHGDLVTGALLLPDHRILSWSEDTTLRLWDRNGMPLAVMEGHKGSVEGADLLPNGNILSWSTDTTLRLWDNNGKALMVMEGHYDYIQGAMLLPKGHILSWSADGSLRLWDEDPKSRKSMDKHARFVRDIQRLPDSRFLSWSWDSIRLWSNDGHLLAVIDGHREHIAGASVLRDDGRILSWSHDATLRLWDPDGTPLMVMTGHKYSVYGALVLPDGRILSWSSDETLRIWDKNGKPKSVLKGHTEKIMGANLLGDGRILSWSADATLRIWDKNGKPKSVLKGHTEEIMGANLLADGRILSWSADTTLRIWDENGKPKSVLKGHTEKIMGAKLVSDGRILSWSEDATLRLWDNDGRSVMVIKGAEYVQDAKILENGLIVAWSINIIHIWDQDGQYLLQHHLSYLRLSNINIEAFNKDLVASKSVFYSYTNTAVIEICGDNNNLQLRWQAQVLCGSKYLFNDGRGIVIQADGQICFIQIYIGNRRANIEELERYSC